MQLIGLLGGMSWESTAEYYRIANELVRDRCGGLHSARCLTYSVDFAPVEEMQRAGDWEAAGRLLAGPACAVAAAIGNPSRSRSRAIARPPCTFESGKGSPLCAPSGSAQYRCNRPAAARPGAKDQRDDRAYCGAKKCRGQQVELLLTLFVRIRLADGCAGAGSPTRRRLQCIGHQGPPP